MRGNKSWKKERIICGIGQDGWGLTHKGRKASRCGVRETGGAGLHEEQPLSVVLPQTCSVNLELTLTDGICLT